MKLGRWLLPFTLTACSKAPLLADARLEFEEPAHDFGRVSLGSTLSHGFVTKNAGNAPLEVQSVVPALGCEGRMAPARLGPSARGRLEVTCKPGVTGPLHVALRVNSNDPRVREVTLKGEVAPRLAFERPYLSLNATVGQEVSESVAIVGERVNEARLELVESTLAGCRAALEGKSLRVSCRADRMGLNGGTVTLASGLDEPPRLSLPCTLDVKSSLRVSPTNPYFNLRLPGPKRVVVEVLGASSDFRVTRAEILEGPFRARLLEHDAAHGFRVEVSVDEARLAAEQRGVNGVLRLHSNAASEPVHDVPLSAFGKPNRAENPG